MALASAQDQQGFGGPRPVDVASLDSAKLPERNLVDIIAAKVFGVVHPIPKFVLIPLI
jgi:hypothetical protein